MSYDCTAKAYLAFEEITKILQDASPSAKYDEFQYAEKQHFCEIGSSRLDGAVVGAVYEIIDDSHCKLSGSFHIDPDGHIVRFPGSNRYQRSAAEQRALKRYAEAYPTKL